MTSYPDTSFLCALYRKQDNSSQAIAHYAKMREPLAVASPLLFEFRQSTRWQAYLHARDGSKGFSKTMAEAMLAKLQSNLASGAVMLVPVDWPDVASIAERLSAQHTWTQGYRAFDILHLATAIHLGAREFLTFDGKQKLLAQAEGISVPW